MGKSGQLEKHNFAQELAWSEFQSDEPFWDSIYRKAFPNMVNHMLCSGDIKSQRLGIDRSVLLASGRTLYIDEKKRRKDSKDILLEYVSVDSSNAPGWIEKDLAIDYLAYAFMPSQKVYLFDWLMLRRAWCQYRTEWIAKGEKKEGGFWKVIAQNVGYNTISVAIPINILRNAVSLSYIIKLESHDN